MWSSKNGRDRSPSRRLCLASPTYSAIRTDLPLSAEAPARRSAKDHGGACNVNVHLHQLLIDGAYELNADKIAKEFHKTAPPTVPELEGLVKTIAHRVAKYLEKNGIIVKDDDAPLQLNIPMEEGFSHLQAASSSYRFLLGPNKEKKALVLKTQVDRDHLGKVDLLASIPASLSMEVLP
ncbi:MAG: transposase [Bdellovibrionales bacterium]|nr:transposase [Bdellovibrionales bacterium]